jgi:hypothetical protein
MKRDSEAMSSEVGKKNLTKLRTMASNNEPVRQSTHTPNQRHTRSDEQEDTGVASKESPRAIQEKPVLTQ